MKKDPGKLFLLIGASIALALLFDFLIYRHLPGLSYPVFTGFLLGVIVILTRSFKRELDFETVTLSMSLFVLSFMVFLRANPILIALDIVVSFYLFVLLVAHLAKFSVLDFKIVDYVRQFFLTLGYSVKGFFQAASDAVEAKAELASNKTIAQVGFGVAITLPVLAVLIILFASADLVFEKYVGNIIESILKLNLFEHLIVIATVAVGLIGFLTYGFCSPGVGLKKGTVGAVEHGIASSRKGLGIIEASILLGSVNVLFAIFVILQATYLFGGKQNIAQQGFSYAEYAHRGFFELVIVALLSFLIIRTAELTTRKSSLLHSRIFKFLAGMLIGLVILIMVSAFIRLSIYEGAYGFTRLRLFTQIFIVMLGSMFLIFLYKLIRERGDSWLAVRTFAVALTFLFGVNIANIDATIGQLNINRYKVTHNGELLMYTLSQLSDDAMTEKLIAFDLENPSAAGTYRQNRFKGHAARLKKQPWQSYNLSRTDALYKLRARGVK